MANKSPHQQSPHFSPAAFREAMGPGYQIATFSEQTAIVHAVSVPSSLPLKPIVPVTREPFEPPIDQPSIKWPGFAAWLARRRWPRLTVAFGFAMR